MPEYTSRVPATMTPNSLNLYHQGKMWAVPSSHVNFHKIKVLLNRIDELNQRPASDFWTIGGLFADKETRIQRQIKKLNLYLDVPSYITHMTEGKVVVTEGGVLYDGEIVHNELTTRIIQHLKSQLDVMPLVRFMNRVKANPKADIGEELFEWMQASGLPITEDGYLIAFKRVAPDYSSFRAAPDGEPVFNSPGTIVTMDREAVDPDRYVTCSSGLHFCGFDYLGHYWSNVDSRVVVLEIDPADVCAIPTDYGYQKGRGCRYKVVGQLGSEESDSFFKDKYVVTGETLAGGAYAPPTKEVLVEVSSAWIDEPANEDDTTSSFTEDYAYEYEYDEFDAYEQELEDLPYDDPDSPYYTGPDDEEPEPPYSDPDSPYYSGPYPEGPEGPDPVKTELFSRINVPTTAENLEAFEKLLAEFEEKNSTPRQKTYGTGYPYE